MALWNKLRPEWEAGVRERLEKTRQWLFSSEGARLLSALRTKLPELEKAYVVGHIPEQGEDLYTVVVGPDLLAFVELDRMSAASEPIVELKSASEYRQQGNPGTHLREGIEVAVQLMRE